MNNKINKIRLSQINQIEEFDEPLAQPGKIFLAEIHGSAQHFLKIKKLSKYIRFCKCCLLPSETPGVVIPYTCLDKKEDFGIGIQLYFVYILFCMVICFSAGLLCTIPSMIYSKKYFDDLTEYCDYNYNYTDKNLSNITEYCFKYLSAVRKSEEIFKEDLSVIKTDWIVKFSAENIVNYYKIFEEKSSNPEIITDSLLNYSFIYFLAAIVLLIINFIFIHYINLLDDKENFESTTPRDYTLLIHGVKRPNKNISKIQHLINIISEISQDYFKIELHHIIPCYDLVELYKLTKEVFEDKIKIYHAYNFKRQKNLHKMYAEKHNISENEYQFNNYYNNQMIKLNAENKNNSQANINQDNYPININNSQLSDLINQKEIQKSISWGQLNQNTNQIFIHDNKLNYYIKFLCMIKATPLNEIEQRIAKKNKRIQEIEKDLSENPDKHSSGTYFVVFKYMKMKDQFYDFYPTHLLQKIFFYMKYFFQNIIFDKCVSERTKRMNYLKKEIKVENATEAYEVIWQNLGFSLCKKTLLFSLSFVMSLVLFGISFVIIYILNYWQFQLTEEGNEHEFYEYLLSFVISIIISLINSLGRKVLKYITRNFEAIETKTEYYISLSSKITIFTFINTNIVPLISNLIQREYDDNSVLLNNVFVIFLTNFTLNPLVFYLNPNLLVKLSKRARARMALEGLPLEDSIYTQDELNRLFQNPSMSLCYKYGFYSNVVLTTFFYMSIFPLGAAFSFLGLLLSYFLEIVHLGFYKRPELLNSRLCKYFVNNFKVAMAVFAIGNYIFLHDAEKHYDINWCLVNLILFIVIVFIPYYSFKINLLGITEGEITKGSYEDYELTFPTDYEKQNPLTKKQAMIKYFKKLRKMNYIDDIQSEYLINRIKRENNMVSYYKTSKNVGNILNYYEFQNQFVKLKKKYKFIKEKKIKQRKINKYDLYINQKAKERRETLATINNLNFPKSPSPRKIAEDPLNNNINIKNNQIKANNLDEYSHLGYNKKYKIKGLVEDEPKLRRKISRYMRETLFQSVKDQGLYSETEESDDDSNKSGNSEETSNTNNSIITNTYKTGDEYKITNFDTGKIK